MIKIKTKEEIINEIIVLNSLEEHYKQAHKDGKITSDVLRVELIQINCMVLALKWVLNEESSKTQNQNKGKEKKTIKDYMFS